MFYGREVMLRLLEEEDATNIVKYYNDYDFKKNLDAVIPFSLTEEVEFIKNTWKWKNEAKSYIFGIEELETKTLIGSCGINDVNWINKSGVLGIGIWIKNKQNRGYGADATKTILKFAFRDLGFHSIRLNVYSFNENAFHVYEKIGFKQIGKSRESKYHNGKFYDTIMMDMLDTEFKD